jgi:hypothetical protein
MKNARIIKTSEYPVNGSPKNTEATYRAPMIMSGSRTRWKNEISGISLMVIGLL